MLSVHRLHLRQGAFQLMDVSFHIPKGRYAVLMGKTGGGKTSILEAIAGLRPVVSGKIRIADQDVTDWPASSRGIGYVPQDGALFPTMSIRRQLGFSLEIRERPADEIHQRVNELADWLGITHLLDRTPKGLSGGEIQRVALGRALAFRPKALLLDEPLSSLDDETRKRLIEWLNQLRQCREVTALHITHNPAEAEALADVRLRLEGGRLIAEPSLPETIS